MPSHYAVTYAVSDEKAGTINAEGYESAPASVAYGESITFTAKANPYYFISGWQVDGKPQEGTANQTSFTLTNVTEPHNVTAVFSASISYTVGYQALENGSLAVTSNGEALTLEPGQTAQVWGGSKLVFTAAPEEKHMVSKWTVNGEEVTRGNMAAYGMTNPYQNTLTVSHGHRRARHLYHYPHAYHCGARGRDGERYTYQPVRRPALPCKQPVALCHQLDQI